MKPKSQHYQGFSVPPKAEAIDIIEASLARWQNSLPLSVCYSLAQALKYILRAGLKDDPCKDIRKARDYLSRAINLMEGKAEW